MSAAKLATPQNSQVLTDPQLKDVIAFLEHGGLDAQKVLKIEDNKVTVHFTTSTGFSFYFQCYQLIEKGEWVRYFYSDIAICRIADEELKKDLALFVCEQSINCVYPHRAGINGDILSVSMRSPLSYLDEAIIRQVLENSYDLSWSLFELIKLNFPTIAPFLEKTSIH